MTLPMASMPNCSSGTLPAMNRDLARVVSAFLGNDVGGIPGLNAVGRGSSAKAGSFHAFEIQTLNRSTDLIGVGLIQRHFLIVEHFENLLEVRKTQYARSR